MEFGEVGERVMRARMRMPGPVGEVATLRRVTVAHVLTLTDQQTAQTIKLALSPDELGTLHSTLHRAQSSDGILPY